MVYGTAPGQSGPAYPGGTILEGDTVRIDDGGTVTGDIANSGTLQFNQTSGSLAITGTYTGGATATLSLTSGGTVSLQQSPTTTIIDGAVNVQAGSLTTGTSALVIGSTGTDSLSISGNGNVVAELVRARQGRGQHRNDHHEQCGDPVQCVEYHPHVDGHQLRRHDDGQRRDGERQPARVGSRQRIRQHVHRRRWVRGLQRHANADERQSDRLRGRQFGQLAFMGGTTTFAGPAIVGASAPPRAGASVVAS